MWEFEIKPADPSDAEELLAIYAPYVEETAVSFEYEVPSVEEFKHRIETISEKYPYLKMVSTEGMILGYAYAGVFKGRRAYDWSVETTIYMRQDRHRRGLGRILYMELERRLKEMGILNLNACIAVPKEEDPYLTTASILFHENLGYLPVGTFHSSGYKFNRWYDMIWMEKMIGEHLEHQPEVAFGKKEFSEPEQGKEDIL